MKGLIFFIIFVVFIIRKIAEASRNQRQARSGQRQRKEEVELSEDALQAFLQQRKPQGQGQPALPPPPPQRPQFAPGERPERDDEEVLTMFRSEEAPPTTQARAAPSPPPTPGPAAADAIAGFSPGDCYTDGRGATAQATATSCRAQKTGTEGKEKEERTR